MSKVYIVQCGDYSDRHVAAVFSTKDLADEAARTMFGDVDEFDVDPEFVRRNEGVVIFDVYSMANSVEVDRVSACPHSLFTDYAEHASLQEVSKWASGVLATKCFAMDEAHATKIAADRFRQHVAERGWK